MEETKRGSYSSTDINNIKDYIDYHFFLVLAITSFVLIFIILSNLQRCLNTQTKNEFAPQYLRYPNRCVRLKILFL